MKPIFKKIDEYTVSFIKILRLTFVIFSLFLMGDAFYRWDGFRFYASIHEFIPAVALIFIFWSIIASITSFFIWLIFRLALLLCKAATNKLHAQDVIIFIPLFFLSTAAVFYIRRLIPVFGSEAQMGSVLLSISVIVSAIFTALLRKFHDLLYNIFNAILERITPLVWVFSVLLIISIPIIAYNTWFKSYKKPLYQTISQDTETGRQRPNIILVTFDALTAKDMSLYGYNRPTTPFITKWAENSSVFSKAEAESNATTPTTASLMTGKRLWTHHTIHQKGSKPVNVENENLPLLLKNNGYYTMAFITNSYAAVEVLGVNDYFDIAPPVTAFHNSAKGFDALEKFVFQLFGNKIRLSDWLFKEDFIFFKLMKYMLNDYASTELAPEIAFNRFISTLDNDASHPYFAWIHLFPPHNPYLPPPPFMGMFDHSSDLRTRNSQRGLLQARFNPETALIARGRYDEFIRYCDSQFESFIHKMTEENLLENTVFILSADHGESFEHGRIGHSFTSLYEETTHIPLIIKEYSQQKGLIIDQVIEQVDIPATILDLAGINIPQWMEGRSLVPLLRGGTMPSIPVFSGFFDNNPAHSTIERGVVATWEGDYKLLYYLKSGNTELFNLKNDPAELNDLFNINKDVSKKLLKITKDHLQEANKKIMMSY